MSVWMAALLALLPALVVPTVMACRGDVAGRLVAVQLGSSIAAFALVAMTFAFDQSSFIDLPLTMILLSLPGTLAFALFLERWL